MCKYMHKIICCKSENSITQLCVSVFLCTFLFSMGLWRERNMTGVGGLRDRCRADLWQPIFKYVIVQAFAHLRWPPPNALCKSAILSARNSPPFCLDNDCAIYIPDFPLVSESQLLSVCQNHCQLLLNVNIYKSL